jgi:hypothetical protein
MLLRIYAQDLGPAIAAAFVYLHLSHTPDISCEWQLPTGTFILVIHTQSNLAIPTLRHQHYHTATKYYYYLLQPDYG